MRSALKFVLALLVTTLLMLAFRALCLTTYTVEGDALKPSFVNGDHVLVNRWSYGLRTGGGRLLGCARWFGSPPGRGDLVAFNCPLDSASPVAYRPVYICFCTALPGDSVKTGGMTMTVPGRMHIISVTEQNAPLLSFIYNHYENRKAAVRGGTLYLDGTPTRCAAFSKDYYWMTSGRRNDYNDSRFFGFVPDDHIIGKVSMLLYSVDPNRPFYDCLRSGRTLLNIRTDARKVP